MYIFKLLVIVVMVTVSEIVLVGASPAKYYATKYDHLDIEEILNNRRMVYYYANCLVNKGPCPPQGLDLKRILPEALETNCERCTEKQKVVTYRSIKRLKKEYPKTWALLQAQWDPNDVYVKRFEESFRQTPPTTPSENEIIIEDRFGDNSPVVTVPSTTKQTKDIKRKPATESIKPSTPPTIKTSRVPTINNVASASDKKPLRSPQNEGGQDIGTNIAKQVGLPRPKDETSSGNRFSSTVKTISSTPLTTTNSPTSPRTVPTTRQVLSDDPIGVTFDIPKSSMNHPQTQELLRNTSSPTKKPNKPKPSVSVPPKSNPTSPKPSDPISSLVFSFLNVNRPTTIRPTTSSPSTTTSNYQNLQIKSQKISGHVRKPGLRRRTQLAINTTVQVSLRKPLIQVRLPGVAVNSQVEGFNPVGNLVRGLADAGDRLIETGTSIADSVLTSVRGLFSPRVRRNRALKRS